MKLRLKIQSVHRFVNNDTNMQTSQYGGYLIFDVLDNKHEIPDISRSLTVMNSITKKQIGLFTRRRKTIIFCIRRGTENGNSKGNTG